MLHVGNIPCLRMCVVQRIPKYFSYLNVRVCVILASVFQGHSIVD